MEKVCSHVIVLRSGKMLYNGPTDAITNNHGFFELAATDNQLLIETLQKNANFEKVYLENGVVKAFAKKTIEPTQLNRLLFEEGIVLSMLIQRKESLEEQFLQLTEKK
ncbi:Bacitracin transport ATP-binding protein bcrA (fragment) [Capnocytophaga canimorsus]|uniref:Bacitracin transport ATP-binding protein bcrA n=1 Tax=Capnocytophaga canimorsus TaxID=28188 RepID=A0A0B7H0J6_9FLAO